MAPDRTDYQTLLQRSVSKMKTILLAISKEPSHTSFVKISFEQPSSAH